MAMTTCRECGADVSNQAQSCPNCGIRNPARSRRDNVIKFGVVLAVGIAALTAMFETRGGSTIRPQHASQGQNVSVAQAGAPVTARVDGDSADDQAAMQSWQQQYDLCQGSSDSAITESSCAKSDTIEKALAKRGWCWSYQDWRVVRADYHWHNCAEKAPPGFTSADPPDPPALDTSLSPLTATLPSSTSVAEEDTQLREFKPGLSAVQRQRIIDARAAVRDAWKAYGANIRNIEFGFGCGLTDRLTSKVAIGNIQIAMGEEFSRSGLIGDNSMNIRNFIQPYINDGRNAAQSGACASMTSTLRGQLRMTIDTLAH